jgi:pSer/pThr/pTyr-binding forkhead associated (FHA) protein
MRMKVVLVMFKDEERREFTLTDKTTVIGRRPDSALRIPTGDVSRQHCEIVVSDDSVVVRDLGSSNGTYVNGKRIAETKLTPGDRLGVGPVVFVVQIDGKPRDIKAADAVPPKPAEAEEEEILDLDELDLELDEGEDEGEDGLDVSDDEDEEKTR